MAGTPQPSRSPTPLPQARKWPNSSSGPEGFAPRIVVLRDAAERPALLLPLAIRSGYGLRIASIVGGRHANYHLPLLDPRATPPADVRASLIAVGRRLAIDVFDFINLPRRWQGRANPLVLPTARPNPSDAYAVTLGPDSEDTLKRALSKDARKKLRQKEHCLAKIGPVAHGMARTPAEVDRILTAYFAQKTTRFRALGLTADVEHAPMRAFVRDACLAGLEAGRPAVELHALQAGGRIAAVFGVAADGRRASGMFTSFDEAPELAKCSPGDVLIARIVAGQCERGRATFDLDVGEARYKASFCRETDELVSITLPVTALGFAVAGALRASTVAKRLVKRTPWAWCAVGALRAARAKLRA